MEPIVVDSMAFDPQPSLLAVIQSQSPDVCDLLGVVSYHSDLGRLTQFYEPLHLLDYMGVAEGLQLAEVLSFEKSTG